MTDANGATNFTQQFAINGQRGVEATFAMDGRGHQRSGDGRIDVFSNFNVDAVEGINPARAGCLPEIGRGASGFTNIVTRSGAADFTAQSLSLCATPLGRAQLL
jgi:hypothetical protein